VENVALLSSSTLGVAFSTRRWIFIGAKLSDHEREQEIKGVLAHELCHYVMFIVYSNSFFPYYKYAIESKNSFDEIVKTIDKWSAADSTIQDDECNEIISSVFESYQPEQFHYELIVRAVQILVLFDTDQKKSNYLQNKYKGLFDFWYEYVVPEMLKYLLKDKEIVKLNGMVGLLSDISIGKYEFIDEYIKDSDIKTVFESNFVTVLSNVPRLFLINVHKYLQRNVGCLEDSQNFFTEPEKLNNLHIWNDFNQVCLRVSKLNIFVDCSMGVPSYLTGIFITKNWNFTFILSNINQIKAMNKIFDTDGISPTSLEINYEWNDLTEKSQRSLLEKKINFQGNTQFSLADLLLSEAEKNSNKEVFSEVIDSHLLNLLLKNSEIKINTDPETDQSEKKFRLLFQARNLIKRQKKAPDTQNSIKVEKSLRNKTVESSVNFSAEFQNNLHKNIDNKHEKNLKNFSERINNEFLNLFNIKPQVENAKNLRDSNSDGILDISLHTINLMKNQMDEDIISGNINEPIKTVSLIPQEKLLLDVENKHYILLSDIAGSGKSWMMRNFTNVLREKNPTKWVTYVDLKLHLDGTEAEQAETDFLLFITKQILKKSSEFEAKIFKQFYLNGKVIILFDGFDEITPDHAETVLNFVQSFEFNGGNQLWISTRDHFEIDLRQKLQLDVVYSLDAFTLVNGINLIVESWVLGDLDDLTCIKSNDEFKKYVGDSPNLKKYQQKVQIIIEKFVISQNISFGLPQLFKMIADGYKDDKNTVPNLKGLEFYTKFVEILYKRWSEEKGQIRKRANIDSLRFQFNFWRFHQFIAIKSCFPKFVKILFNNYDGREWPDTEVNACGLCYKKGEIVYFLHETFRELFAADFFAKALKDLKLEKRSLAEKTFGRMFNKKEYEDCILEILCQILTIEKFEVIRMFLNDAIEDYTVLEKIRPRMQKFVKRFYELNNFGDFFAKKLDHLTVFVIDIIKRGNYKQVRTVLNKCYQNFALKTENPDVFLKFQEFLFNFFKIKHLRTLIINLKLTQRLIKSNFKVEIFESFVTKMSVKIDNQVREAFLLSTKDILVIENIFGFLCRSSNLDDHKVQTCFKIMQKYLSFTEIIGLIKHCNEFRQNILHIIVLKGNKKDFEILWLEIKNFLRNMPQNFINLVEQTDSKKENILHCAAWSNETEFYAQFWETLFEFYKNLDDLTYLILQREYWGNNFIHYLIENNNSSEIIELTFEILKNKLSHDQYKTILHSYGRLDMNLLQTAVWHSKATQVHQILWKNVRSLCENNEEFLDILNDVDNTERNIFHLAAWSSSCEVFEFMIKELEKTTSSIEIKNILTALDGNNRHLLHEATTKNQSLSLHECLWKTIRNYLEPSEILKFIYLVDRQGENLLLCAVRNNTKEIVELTWNEIKSFMNTNEQIEYLTLKGWLGKNLIERSRENFYSEVSAWVENLLDSYNLNNSNDINNT